MSQKCTRYNKDVLQNSTILTFDISPSGISLYECLSGQGIDEENCLYSEFFTRVFVKNVM